MIGAAFVVVAALPLVALFAYSAGVRRGERIGEALGRRRRWTDRDERWLSTLERIEP